MTRPTYETLLALAEAVTTAHNRGRTLPDCVEEQWHTYRSECQPKLRTRAEVDAELVSLMRGRCGRESSSRTEDQDLWLRFKALCAEPTREPEAAFDPRDWAKRLDPKKVAEDYLSRIATEGKAVERCGGCLRFICECRDDPRPKCIQCGRRWTPDESVDATKHVCINCHSVNAMRRIKRGPE